MNDQRLRPVVGGISSGNLKTGATGTVGLPVYDAQTGALLILSNWHVFGSKGGNILQPGPGDGGDYGDRVAVVTRSKSLSPDEESEIDAAVAKPLYPSEISKTILGIGEAAGSVPAEVGMEIYKSGRTTQLTQGVVTDINAALDIKYRDVGVVSLKDLIFFKGEEPVVMGGDSGSALVTYIDGKPYVVGVVFAGPGAPPYNYGVACKIENIAKSYGVITSSVSYELESKSVIVSGRIMDIQTQVQIPHARVSINGVVSYTDSTGLYTLGLEEPGMYTITVAAIGYQGGEISVNLWLGENEISITLHPKSGLPIQDFIPLVIGITAGTITIVKVVGD